MAPAKPRLLVLTSTFPRWHGDTEPAFVLELCRRLLDGFEVQVLAPHAPGAKVEEVLLGVPVRRFRYSPERWETLAYGGGIPARLRHEPWRILQLPLFLAALLFSALILALRWRLDLIHAHWIVPQGLIAGILKVLGRGHPAVLCTIHGADLHALNGSAARFLKSWTLRRMDAVTVVGSAMLPAAVKLGADPAGIAVASMGADLETRFIPGTAARDWNLVVFAGRLVEKKGVRHLLEALPRARERIPSLRLVIAGDGPERAALESRARKLGVESAVEFRGAVAQDELAALFRAAGAAVFPFVTAEDGDQEGLGLVVIEAQGCGCPVIAADVPAVRDTIVDGETGLLVPPADASSLADRIVQVLNDWELAAGLGANGRRAALAAFGWERCAGRYRDILLRILDTADGNPR